MYVI
jgi:hypothetical protein